MYKNVNNNHTSLEMRSPPNFLEDNRRKPGANHLGQDWNSLNQPDLQTKYDYKRKMKRSTI